MKNLNLDNHLHDKELLEYIKSLEKNEKELDKFIANYKDDYGVFLVAIFTEIANSEQSVFWYLKIVDYYLFDLCYLEGAQRAALFYTIKTYELDKDKLSVSEKIQDLEGILNLGMTPEILFSDEEIKYYENEILKLDPNYTKASKSHW